jgi:DNA-binding response OmpR family regulator/predicted regulator of Ras-like GTPase activity (Roadblock/LC7/MglB family)
MTEQWRILVVEGDESLNWNIVNTLQKDGYIVLGVTGGAEAIRTLWSEEYDVVICSQQMPDADGFDLLQWMRTYCPNARMVMLGIPGGGINRTQALEMGVASYLEKPLDMHALKEELRRLLHQTGFSASLDSFDLLDVIQIITMSRKSIALVVSTGLEEQGLLRFQAGELIWAEYGTLRGEEAFFALAAHKNGTVVHRPWNDQITPNVTLPLSRLIFQALQYRSKYAEYQQMSSELEAVKPGNTVPDPPTLTPLTSAPFSGLLDDLEEDDTPFQFVSGELSTEGGQMGASFEQVWRNGSTSARMEQIGGTRGEPGQPDGQKKAWWEPTGAYPSLPASANLRAVTDGEPEQAFPRNGSLNSTPSSMPKTGADQNNALPSWLTDQPTHHDLPVLRGSTGQMPVVPVERSPVLPKTPPTSVPSSPLPSFSTSAPNQTSDMSAEWPALPRPTGMNLSDSGLRKINPEESQFTTPHRAVRTNGNPSARPGSSELQGSVSGPLNGQSGPMGAPNPPSFTERKGDTLQSLAALKRAGTLAPVSSVAPSVPVVAPVRPVPSASAAFPVPAAPAASSAPATSIVDSRGGRNGAVSVRPTSEIGAKARLETNVNASNKRNYPALAAALQTIGYSVAGFVASAVVGLDGTPIAQVAVDEMDISPLCTYLSTVVQGASRAIERGGACEHIVITSNTQHILLRILSKKKEVFQVLITSRETTPAECLDVLTNVEAALTAAL